MNNNNPQAPARCLMLHRKLQALKMRQAGCSYSTIATKLGVCVNTARGYVKDAMEENQKQIEEAVDDYRFLAMARLDRMFVEVYKRAIKGDEKAIAACLAIEAQRAKLMGAEKATGPSAVHFHQTFAGLPEAELVEMARQRGLPIPAGLLPAPGQTVVEPPIAVEQPTDPSGVANPEG